VDRKQGGSKAHCHDPCPRASAPGLSVSSLPADPEATRTHPGVVVEAAVVVAAAAEAGGTTAMTASWDEGAERLKLVNGRRGTVHTGRERGCDSGTVPLGMSGGRVGGHCSRDACAWAMMWAPQCLLGRECAEKPGRKPKGRGH